MSLIPFFARNWPFANGSGRILDKWAQNIDLGSSEQSAKTSDGFSMHVLTDDLIGRHILLSGKFDRSIVQLLLDHARDGDVLLDIGANIGYVTACFLAKVKRSQAICVEPQPGIVELLQTNMEQFGDRVVTHQVALSDESGELRFHIDKANRGASRISDDGEIVVSAIAAGKFLRSVVKLDIVKIDVEGHEQAIFTGLRDELARLKPRAILFEDQLQLASPQGAIGSILHGIGYKIYGVDKKLFMTSLVEVNSSQDCRFNDYLALID
ncbi:MAG: FkbM family methyltransferase [Parasphingorhabdus sp.]|uniref:FkbM family methyltransferase n=1 Tax=Parasphingorhabdus sp. TaxID=2709688 RepID=UPI0030016BE2